MAIFDSLIKPALDSVTTLISQFHMSPEEKVQATQALNDAALKAQTDSENYEVQLNQIAGNNIQSEAKSGNWLTVLARPIFLYLMYGVILFNFVLLPLVQYFGGKPLQPINLPAELWFMFSTGYLGYVTARSFDKQQGLSGQSNITLPFGISATNVPSKKV